MAGSRGTDDAGPDSLFIFSQIIMRQGHQARTENNEVQEAYEKGYSVNMQSQKKQTKEVKQDLLPDFCVYDIYGHKYIMNKVLSFPFLEIFRYLGAGMEQVGLIRVKVLPGKIMKEEKTKRVKSVCKEMI